MSRFQNTAIVLKAFGIAMFLVALTVGMFKLSMAITGSPDMGFFLLMGGVFPFSFCWSPLYAI